MGNSVSRDINDFFTKDIKDAFDKIPNAFKDVGNNISDSFKDVGNTIVDPFKKFGIEVTNTFNEVGDVLDASFEYVKETGDFVGSLTINTFDFFQEVGEQFIKIIPLIVEIIKNLVSFIEKGLNIAPVVLLLLPALGIVYYTVDIINTLDKGIDG